MSRFAGIFKRNPPAPQVVTALKPVVPITIAVDVNGGAEVTIGNKDPVRFTNLANYKNEEALKNLKTNYTEEAAKKKTEDAASEDLADTDELNQYAGNPATGEAGSPSLNGAPPTNGNVTEQQSLGGASGEANAGTETPKLEGGKRRRKTNKRKRAQNRKGRRTMNHRGWH